eukprot:1443069-Prymnesium_polylepis.1
MAAHPSSRRSAQSCRSTSARRACSRASACCRSSWASRSCSGSRCRRCEAHVGPPALGLGSNVTGLALGPPRDHHDLTNPWPCALCVPGHAQWPCHRVCELLDGERSEGSVWPRAARAQRPRGRPANGGHVRPRSAGGRAQAHGHVHQRRDAAALQHQPAR